MTRLTARERGLDLFAFTTMGEALEFACAHLTFTHTGTPHAVAAFHEELAHFPVFFVAVHPRAGEHTFTRARG